MSENIATCITCDRALDIGDSVDGFCPTCLYVAGVTPGASADGAGVTQGMRTSWSDAFPQFETTQTLCDQDGFVAMAGTIASDDSPDGHDAAVLLVWDGVALAAEGGQDALLAQIRKLRIADVPGMAELVDAGDLADAAYLVAKVPNESRPLQIRTSETQESAANHSLEELLPALGRLVGSVHNVCGVALELEPALVFLVPGGGLCLVPRPLIPSGARGEAIDRRGHLLEAGQRVGSYSLVEMVGEGGFGDVWLARQEKPVEREVAVKVLKFGISSPRALTRFEVEQQALARLDHPQVARLLDGGTTVDGRPFFAMEWIAGQSITDYCAREKASLCERVRLFRELCDAVHHAHQKGIIHRDLKPSNVMVTETSGQPAIKVIDFGIAMALEQPLTDRTKVTRAEEIVGTPISMSPEQAAGAGSADLDARTDVYGLGVLLYELLTGTLPFGADLPADELRRQIREDDPPKPGARLAELKDLAVSDSEIEIPISVIAQDLDWIVMRCLEKDAERRYPSVSALSRDLERFLSDEPIEAGPPQIGYRLRKFTRRHRVGLAASGMVLLALVVGLILAIYGLVVSREERAKAVEAQLASEREAAVSDAVSAFLSDELLSLVGSDGSLVKSPSDSELKLRTVLERAAARLDGRFDGLPEVEGAIRRTLASSFLAVGELDKAGQQAELSLTLLDEVSGESDIRTLKALRLLASIRAAQGRTSEAQTLLERVGKHSEDLDIEGELASIIVGTRIDKADLLLERGRVLEAERNYREALKSTDLSPESRASALSGIALIWEHRDDRGKALEEHQKAMAYASEQLGIRHWTFLDAKRRFARLLGDMDFADSDEIIESVGLLRGVLKIQEETLGLNHPDTLKTRYDLVLPQVRVPGFRDGAMQKLRAIVAAAASMYGDDHPIVLGYRLGLGAGLLEDENHTEAAQEFESIIESARRSAGESHPVAVKATTLLAELTARSGRPGDALIFRRQAVDRARKDLSPIAIPRREAVVALGSALRLQGLRSDSIEVLRDELNACVEAAGAQAKMSIHYQDRLLLAFHHDRIGAAAEAVADWALRDGGTPAEKIRSMLKLSLASHMALRPSFFARPSVPLPATYLKLLKWNSTTIDGAEEPRVLVPAAAEWRFLVLSENERIPVDWFDLSFEDEDWLAGSGSLGFGEEDLATDVRKAAGKPSPPASVCFRHKFRVEEFDADQALLLRLRCDDGAVVYLNGREVLRQNLPGGNLTPKTRASRAVSSLEEREIHDFLVPPGILVKGDNLLAAQVFQRTTTSSDLVFSLTLHNEMLTPLECLADFEPTATLEWLRSEFPVDLGELPTDWSGRVEVTSLAALGRWDAALERSRKLKADPASDAALRWFQIVALGRLDREGDANALFQKAIHPRAVDADETLIDLSSHYNALVDEPWHVLLDGAVHEPFLMDFPVGIREFNGVRFDARGILQLGSATLHNQGVVRHYGPSQKAIRLDQRVAKLHLLNGTLLYEEEGAPVASVVVHYKDGGTGKFTLRYWHETITYGAGTDEPPDTVTLGWRGADPFRPGSDKSLCIATWTNPRPGEVIERIDLQSESASAALFVLAITAEPAP